MDEKVSIIMGVYNCENTIATTLDSILAQTYKNWELIICDDASDDNSYQIIRNYQHKDERINLIKNQRNLRLAKTLNICLEQATGDYIMRHDGDDLMVANRIEKQIDYMNNFNCDACGSGAFLFDETGVWGIRQPERNPNKHIMIMSVPFIHPTVMMKRSKLLEVDGYTVNEITLQRLEDYDLWVKFYERGFILHNIQEPLIYFREDQNSYNRKSRKFRVTETKARLDACRRLKIWKLKRILALKPLFVMIIPKKSLRRYHMRKSIQKTI